MNFISQCAFFIPPVLIHIYDPININSYGLFILIGVAIFYVCISKDPWRVRLVGIETLFDVVIKATFVGVAGGRILFALFESNEFSSWLDFFAFWQGGFSVLGSVISIIFFMTFYLYRIGVPVIPLFDLACVYAPLLQAIARFGCFFSGCCFGSGTDLPWAVIYTHIESAAPLHTPLHPTQLYSVLMYSIIFLIIFFLKKTLAYRPGFFLFLYLILSSFERFVIDFLRADRVFYSSASISSYQFLALFISLIGFIGLFVTVYRKKRVHGFI